MNEKRFTMEYSFEDEEYVFCVDGNPLTPSMVLKMLNEQQSTINELQQSQDVKEFSALFNQSIALQREIKDLKEENEKLRNIHLSIDLTYSYGYGGYLADVRVVDND